ncbi:HNH endonuclease [Streptomyces sp. NPDC002221]|uniref:HNH endonuclease n=1 Tax=Streptomyces sp. NPDC002221 TaxID=3364639 RepID=UPI003679AE70
MQSSEFCALSSAPAVRGAGGTTPGFSAGLSSAQNQCLICQANGRCEHKPPLWFRHQADHIRPWSRSGPTELWNGQLLCRRHNRGKANRVPSPSTAGASCAAAGGTDHTHIHALNVLAMGLLVSNKGEITLTPMPYAPIGERTS